MIFCTEKKTSLEEEKKRRTSGGGHFAQPFWLVM
jgi:hypothetical protein